MNYSDKLKDPRWQKKRLEIMSRDEFQCRNCGDLESTLQVHHLEYSNNPWDVDESKLITLCEFCHKQFTEANIEIKSYLSEIKDIDSLEEVASFLKVAKNTNPFDISYAIKFLKFMKTTDYKIAMSFSSFMDKFKELNDGRMD